MPVEQLTTEDSRYAAVHCPLPDSHQFFFVFFFNAAGSNLHKYFWYFWIYIQKSSVKKNHSQPWPLLAQQVMWSFHVWVCMSANLSYPKDVSASQLQNLIYLPEILWHATFFTMNFALVWIHLTTTLSKTILVCLHSGWGEHYLSDVTWGNR